jgi:hypothetical protein
MDISIEEKISLLPPEKQNEFRERLIDVLHDRTWFMMHSMYYVDPDVQKVKETLFREEYECSLSP